MTLSKLFTLLYNQDKIARKRAMVRYENYGKLVN